MGADTGSALMKKRERNIFILLSLAFILNQWLESERVFIPFIHSYLDDLLCIPVILYPVLLIFRKYVYADKNYSFPFSYILTTAVMLSLAFEVWAPSYSSVYISDKYDIPAYVAGGVFFHFFMGGNKYSLSDIQKSFSRIQIQARDIQH